MKTDSERRFDDFTVRQAFYKSIPVLAGYVVIGIGFGPMRRSSADMEAQFRPQYPRRYYRVHGDHPDAGISRILTLLDKLLRSLWRRRLKQMKV